MNKQYGQKQTGQNSFDDDGDDSKVFQGFLAKDITAATENRCKLLME